MSFDNILGAFFIGFQQKSFLTIRILSVIPYATTREDCLYFCWKMGADFSTRQGHVSYFSLNIPKLTY